MFRYKDSVIPTISLFFKYKNDVDIFIEDSNDEEFYKSLFSNLLNGKRVNKIISCRCKTNLLSACENDQIDRKRKRIYLADADLDLILDTNRKDLKHLFVLDRYCIENFLIEEIGIIETLHDCIILDKEKITKELGLENWLKTISHSLIELFLHYAISHEHSLGHTTVSYSVGKLCKQVNKITVLDLNKVDERIKEFREKIIIAIGEDNYNENIYAKRNKWPSNINTFLEIVSAKDYILPLVSFRFKKLKGKETYNLKRETFRMRLAKTCEFDSLSNLKKKIISA
jgi:hypothetical protein